MGRGGAAIRRWAVVAAVALYCPAIVIGVELAWGSGDRGGGLLVSLSVGVGCFHFLAARALRVWR